MSLRSLVESALSQRASDLHLEPGQPATFRVDGELVQVGERLGGDQVLALVREAVGDQGWPEFLARRSFDAAMTIVGVRCRINAMHTMRGVGLALRLLPSIIPTVEALNLHPDLGMLVHNPHGLILVCGATGSGKSSTLAALLQEINRTTPRHIITIEQPVEFHLRPERALIRQREVGLDTPSFEQALMDAMREDPDVIMVGEMRDPECMRLTLNAAETGHLVLATLHSSSCSEALQRLVQAFPAEIQLGICAQLADSLLAVVCQRLHYREDLKIRVPECEILTRSSASQAVIRQARFSKLISVLETGGAEGMYTFERYQAWTRTRTSWQVQRPRSPEQDRVDDFTPGRAPTPRTPPPMGRKVPAGEPVRSQVKSPAPSREEPSAVFEIEPTNVDVAAIVEELLKPLKKG